MVTGAGSPRDVGPEVDLPWVRAELGSALLSDVLDAAGRRAQCLGTGLRPLVAHQVVAGFACPVAIQRVADVPETPFAGLLAALDDLRADEVFVTPTQRAVDIAVWGELLSTAAQARGAAGAITDGRIRDCRQIVQLGFPVVSAGTVPYDSKGRHEVTAHRIPCTIDGVRIEPGDLVVGDQDGVVVVPRAMIGAVLAGADTKRRSERAFRRAVADGMLVTEAFERFGVL